MHIYVPFIMYCSRLFVVDFQIVLPCDGVRQVTQLHISQPSFMFVSAAVSETCKLNQNKKKEEKNSELAISNLTPSWAYIF